MTHDTFSFFLTLYLIGVGVFYYTVWTFDWTGNGEMTLGEAIFIGLLWPAFVIRLGVLAFLWVFSSTRTGGWTGLKRALGRLFSA